MKNPFLKIFIIFLIIHIVKVSIKPIDHDQRIQRICSTLSQPHPDCPQSPWLILYTHTLDYGTYSTRIPCRHSSGSLQHIHDWCWWCWNVIWWNLYVQKVIQKGYSVCIFPEAEYIDETILLNPFKRGAFKLAIEHELPVFPMVFLDCKRKFPWYTTHGYPGRLRVKALDVISVQEIQSKALEKLQELSHQQIKTALENDPKGMALKAIEVWKKKTA